jgi:hypothetical protein
MDELPNDLRDMLELARDEFDPPDDQAKQRVRIALAAAIGVPTVGAVLSGGKAAAMGSKAPAAMAAKAGWLALGGKLTAVAVGTVAAAGVGIALYASRAPTATPVQAPAPNVQAVPAAEAAPTPEVTPLPERAAPTELNAREQAGAEDERAAKPRKVEARARSREQRSVPAADTLAEEMALLRTASEALARGDEEAALVQLSAHGKRYPRGSLREERDGLRAIAECTRDQKPSQQAAQRFAQLYPHSLLAARVTAACRGR